MWNKIIFLFLDRVAIKSCCISNIMKVRVYCSRNVILEMDLSRMKLYGLLKIL